jgi:hypothetical protein
MIGSALPRWQECAGGDVMKTAEEDQRLRETRRELKRLMEESTGQMGPDFVWNREESYADRMLPRFGHPHSDISGKKE